MTINIPIAAKIVALDAFIFRVPLKTPRVNSFGRMTHRSALLVRMRDVDGVEGWGECFSNWPGFAAEHRFRIITEVLASLIDGKTFDNPATLSDHLTSGTRSLRIQCNEPGPFEQAIAAVDIAAWDLASKRAEIPLYQALGGNQAAKHLPVYASGVNPDQAVGVAKRDLARGIRAFKLKVGFGLDADRRALSTIRELIGDDAALMVDANQGWSMAEAETAILAFKEFNLDWVEEPIPADHPAEDFQRLAELGTPIAAGENVRDAANFQRMITVGGLSVVQPDIIKWGGISGCLYVAQDAIERGVRYCPHYLGGGLGLVATAHLLAAVGGDGILEVDAVDNPLRTELVKPFPQIEDGLISLEPNTGIGVTPDVPAIKRYLVQGEGL